LRCTTPSRTPRSSSTHRSLAGAGARRPPFSPRKTIALLPRAAERLELLDPIADRVPELDLAQQSVEWTTLPDGYEALLVNGGAIDGGAGAFFANHGDDVHAYGSLDPIIPGHVGCIVIQPDGSRYPARVEPDPLAQQ
jgi:hypothetical protein